MALRVLHCPAMVGGNPYGLASAERALGLDSHAVTVGQNWLAYPMDEVLLGPTANKLQAELARWRLLWRALRRYDLIHYNFGQTILPMRTVTDAFSGSAVRPLYWFYGQLTTQRELPLLRRAGKGLVVTYQGDDARQGDYCRAHFDISIAREVDSSYYTTASDAAKRRQISQFDRYADRIYYLNPDLGWVLPERARFMPYANVDLREWQIAASPVPERPLILHAPTHQGAKGTRYVLEAVQRLQAEKMPFEFLLIENMSIQEARSVYARADLLVDQLLAGWYGGLAVELMALGKPAICYLREGDLKFVPPAMRQALPLIHATPATIYSVLKEWLTTRRQEIPEMGRRSRAYVEQWHDPLKIAAALKADYEAIMAAKRPRANNSGRADREEHI